MAQEFDAGFVDDTGVVYLPRLNQAFTAGFVADVGQVGLPVLQREYGPNATTAFPAGAPTQSTTLPESALQLVDLDHQHVAWLPLAKGYQARRALADPGKVTATLAHSDPALASVSYDRMLRLWLRGNLVATGLIEPRDDATIDPAEEAGQQVSLGGRGSIAVLEDGNVDPWKLDWLPDMQAHRFSFAHPDYDDSAWGPAYVKAFQGSASPHWTGYPRGWTNPYAAWISGPLGSSQHAPSGTTYFRRTFTLATGGEHALFWTGDNTAELSIDGTPINTIQNWQQLQRVDLTLSAGEHVLAVKTVNIPRPDNNPTALLLTLYQAGEQGRLGDVVLMTEASGWKVLQFPSSTPGWPVGKILRYLLAAWVDRGGIAVTTTFTDTHDTAGQPWPVVPDLTVQCGSNLLQLVRQLSESYMDISMAPGSWTLNAWNKGGRGRDLNLDLSNTTPSTACLKSLRHRTRPPVATSLLVRWQENWLRRTVTPPTGHRRREKHLQVPQIPTEAGAQRLADDLLDVYGREQVEFDVRLRPRTDAQVPAVAIIEGDTLRLPNRDGDLERVRVQSWSVTVDDGGEVAYTIEAGDLIAYKAERLDAWLQRLADGAMEGRTQQALPNRGDTYLYSPSTMVLQPVIFDRDAGTAAEESKPVTMASFATIVEIEADIPGGEAFTATLRVNGVTAATITSAGGIQASELGLDIVVNRGDILTMHSVNLGFDLVLAVRFA